jgi:hypothetical protein
MAKLKDKTAEIQQYRDEQQEALADSTKGFTAIQRIHNAYKITEIEGILKGLDIAIGILKEK